MNLSETPVSAAILQINTADQVGGAAKIAWMLHQAYQRRQYEAWLAVGHKQSSDPAVYRIPNETYWAFWFKLSKRISESTMPLPTRVRRFFLHLAKIHQRMAKASGRENFYFPGSRHVLDLPPRKPDLVHCHNLHGLYFDLRALPRLSTQVPVMLTLHDAWMLSGYCAHSLECERWLTGCGHCPYVDTFPVQRDATAYNWKRKQRIYANSRVYVATPSKWLMQKVTQSMLAPAVVESRVIPNGMDLMMFCPGNRHAVRAELGIPEGAFMVLATAAKIVQNPWKDYATMREAIALLGRKLNTHPIYFLVLGGDQPPELNGRVTVEFMPYQQKKTAVVRYYQAADVYIHAAKADTFPNTVIEALACGTPVVATAIGGIPEQIDDGKTGFLVPPQSPGEMMTAIQQVLQNPSLRSQMSKNAAETARQRFDVNRMVNEYLQWYQEILY